MRQEIKQLYKYLKTKPKKAISAIIPHKFKRPIKILFNKQFREEEKEKKRLNNCPRFTETEIIFLNKKIRIVDSDSFKFSNEEIFEREIYKITGLTNSPYILDCGANIGLGIIYFKQLWPGSKIIAFEPDDKIAAILRYNIKIFDFKDVEIIQKACWNEETTLQFFHEGADAGRVAQEYDFENILQVQTIRLKDFLNTKVDFLKIDIEGAESV